jgi:hypothetical protein
MMQCLHASRPEALGAWLPAEVLASGPSGLAANYGQRA